MGIVHRSVRALGSARGPIGRWVFRHRGLMPLPFLLGVVLFSASAYPFGSTVDWLFDLLGVAVICGGLALRAWTVGQLGSHGRSAKLRAPRLVTSGPYANVRNPIYLANFFIGLGVAITAKNWIALAVFFLVFWAEYGVIVSAEEEFLTRAFGDRYEEYRRRVRRWVPRLIPPQPRTGGAFSLRALRKEHLAALSALGMAGIVELGEHLRWVLL